LFGASDARPLAVEKGHDILRCVLIILPVCCLDGALVEELTCLFRAAISYVLCIAHFTLVVPSPLSSSSIFNAVFFR